MTTDDSFRLQDLIDRGEPLPDGETSFAGQLTIPDGRCLIGSGTGRTRLIYTGEPRGTGAVMVRSGNWGYRVRDVGLTNRGRKGGVGFGLGCDPAGPVNGTQSGMAVWENVTSNGFTRGFQLGDFGGRSTSELTMTHIHTPLCDVGVYAQGWNTLNVLIRQFLPNKCRVGIECTEAHSVHVDGGSATEVEEIFRVRQGGTYSLANFRAEGCARLATVSDVTAACSMTLTNNLTSGRPPGDGVDVWGMWGAMIDVRGGQYAGKFVYDSYPPTDRPIGYGSVSMTGVFTRAPVLLEGRAGVMARYDLRNCGTLDAGNQVLQRFSGSGVIGDGPIPPEFVTGSVE